MEDEKKKKKQRTLYPLSLDNQHKQRGEVCFSFIEGRVRLSGGPVCGST